MKSHTKQLTFGFIGVGTITEAVVTGLCKTEFSDCKIIVSPRNREVAARLASAHTNVHVAKDNQDVIDQADVVFLAIRVQIVEDVVRSLRFRADQRVISFVAATPLARLAAWIGQPIKLSQAVPLPFVANLEGSTAIYPSDEVATAVFTALGTAVEVERKRQYDLLAVSSSLMGTYFALLETTSTWLEQQGLPRSAADTYLRTLFSALGTVTATRIDSSFAELSREYATHGGTNEQLARLFFSHGGGDALTAALASVLARIEGGASHASFEDGSYSGSGTTSPTD